MCGLLHQFLMQVFAIPERDKRQPGLSTRNASFLPQVRNGIKADLLHRTVMKFFAIMPQKQECAAYYINSWCRFLQYRKGIKGSLVYQLVTQVFFRKSGRGQKPTCCIEPWWSFLRQYRNNSFLLVRSALKRGAINYFNGKMSGMWQIKTNALLPKQSLFSFCLFYKPI